jgi:hypothetical protein
MLLSVAQLDSQRAPQLRGVAVVATKPAVVTVLSWRRHPNRPGPRGGPGRAVTPRTASIWVGNSRGRGAADCTLELTRDARPHASLSMR